MTRSRSHTFLATAAVIPLTALALASCGGGSSDATASKAPPKTPNGRPATVGVANSGLGKILVNSKGRTLSPFKKDQGTKSTCFGACASAWPPLLASRKPTVGSGAKTSMVGTTARSDGPQQVTYNGHPLYLYAGDEKAGDTEGQGVTAFGGRWSCSPRRETRSPARHRAQAPDRTRAAAVATSPGDQAWDARLGAR